MKYTIIEFDRDYRTVTGNEEKEFDSYEEAEKWCQNNSWTGYDYFVEKSKEDKESN